MNFGKLEPYRFYVQHLHQIGHSIEEIQNILREKECPRITQDILEKMLLSMSETSIQKSLETIQQEITLIDAIIKKCNLISGQIKFTDNQKYILMTTELEKYNLLKKDVLCAITISNKDDMHIKSVIETLENYLKENNITVTECLKEISIPKTTFNNILKKKRVVNVANLLRIQDYLKNRNLLEETA